MKWTVGGVLLTTVFFTILPSRLCIASELTERAAGSAGSRAGCAAVVGTWLWMNGAEVRCFADGSCTASNGFSGRWRCLDPSGRFEIQWARPGQPPQFVDSVDVSAGGRRLSGRNQYGVGVGAERVIAVVDVGEMGVPARDSPGDPLGDETARLDDYEAFDETSPLFDCTPRIMNTSLGVETGLEVRVEVFGLENGRCHFHQTVIADEHGLGLSGMEMTCRLPRDDNSRSLLAFCEGSLVTTYLKLVEGS